MHWKFYVTAALGFGERPAGSLDLRKSHALR